MEPIAAQHAHGRGLGRLRPGRSRLVVENAHLADHRARAEPSQRDLAAFMVEVDAHLTFEYHKELRADVALQKKRLALRVMPGDHQAVDARQLFESESTEQRHSLDRDELL